jgi:hypothetical protein
MLKPDTEAVWEFLRQQPGLTGFVLVGGSALALLLAHRQSEDLDFVWPGPKLPRDRLEALRRASVAAGLAVAPHDNPIALREFADGGLDLLDFQQDYLMGKGVKVTFFAPEPYALTVLEAAAEAPTSGPRLASLPELFRSKALLSARRSRSRDYFDLHVLMVRCGFTMSDYHSAFERAGIPEQAPIGLSRLCAPTAVAADPGYDTLAPDAPSREELVRFFVEQRDRFERSEAARAFRDALRRKSAGTSSSGAAC